MKRLIPIMIVAAVALPSCNDEPGGSVQPAGAITFGAPVMEVETRSTFKDALEVGDSFGVLGYCLAYTVNPDDGDAFEYTSGATVWRQKYNVCPPAVFYKQRVTVQQDGTCTYDRTNPSAGSGNNPKFWYADGVGLDGVAEEGVTNADNYLYTFFAYSPYDAFRVIAPADENTASAPVFRFDMPQAGSTASTVLDHTITPDAMLAVLYNSRKNGGNLQFNFSHALTGLGFKINNYSSRHLLVDHVELQGTFYKTLEIDCATSPAEYTTPAASTYSGTYVIYDSLMDLSNDGNSTVVSHEPEADDYVMLIAGTENKSLGPDSNELTINIRYKFWEDGESEPDEWTTKSLKRTATFTFRSGMRYVAELDFVGDAFTINFVQANNDMWQDGEADDDDETNDDIVFE